MFDDADCSAGPLELCRRPKKLVYDDYVLLSPSSSPSLNSAPNAPPHPAHLPSFGQAADDLSLPPALPSSSNGRPELHERTSAPATTSTSSPSPSRAPPPPPPSVKRTLTSTPLHRRTRSDYSTFSSPSSPSSPSRPSRRPPPPHPAHQQTPLTTYAKTTRSPSVTVPLSNASGLAHDKAPTAARLRKPLDDLSASLEGRGGSSALSISDLESGAGLEGAEEEGEEGEEEEDETDEETGVSLMRRLDRVEQIERDRLRRARKTDERAREALDSSFSALTTEVGIGSASVPNAGAGQGWVLRRGSSSSSTPTMAKTRKGKGVKKEGWGRRLFHRSASDQHQGSEGRGERRGLLTPPGEEEDEVRDGEGGGAEGGRAEELGRMSMSWHGGGGGGGGTLSADEGDVHGTARVKGKKRWVVVEVRLSLPFLPSRPLSSYPVPTLEKVEADANYENAQRIVNVAEPRRRWWTWGAF